QACSRDLSSNAERPWGRRRKGALRGRPRARGLRRTALARHARDRLHEVRHRPRHRWYRAHSVVERIAGTAVSEPKKRPGRLWLFFYGRQRRGFPWLLVGLAVAIFALALSFAIPGWADYSRAV